MSKFLRDSIISEKNAKLMVVKNFGNVIIGILWKVMFSV